MRLKRNIALAFILLIGIIIFSTVAYTSNNGKSGFTGSPGENACNNCHNTNPLNSGGGSVRISSPNMPNWIYTPGMSYTINVTVKKTGIGKFGFGFEALLPSGANAGLIQTTFSPNAKSLSATVQGNSRNNAVHKQPNHFGTDSLVFSFTWVAPAVGTGNVTFYAAGNATNSMNNSSGDFIYTTNQLLTEGSTVQINSYNDDYKTLFFPIPSKGELNFNVPYVENDKYTMLQIFDLQGKLVYHQNIVSTSNISSGKINIDFLESGTYLIHLQNNDWHYQQKIMLVK